MRLASNRQRVSDLPTVRDAISLLSSPRKPRAVKKHGDNEEEEPDPLVRDWTIEEARRVEVLVRDGELVEVIRYLKEHFTDDEIVDAMTFLQEARR